MTSRLAVVPARAGSKRIPDKNIREFFGRPMIAYILDAARASGLFDTIHVSTESSRIANVVDALGFPITFLRPAELADDHTPLMPVLRHVVSTFSAQGRTFDEVWLLMACAPLIAPEDLREAARLLTKAGRQRPVIAVARYPAPFERAFRKEAEGTLVPIEPAAMKLRSQDLEARYYILARFVRFRRGSSRTATVNRTLAATLRSRSAEPSKLTLTTRKIGNLPKSFLRDCAPLATSRLSGWTEAQSVMWKPALTVNPVLHGMQEAQSIWINQMVYDRKRPAKTSSRFRLAKPSSTFR